MKNTLILIFAALTCTLSAQSDTSYIVNIGGQYFEVTQTLQPVGDSATLENLYLSRATNEARQFSQSVNTTWQKDDFVSRILDANGRLQQAVGKSVVKASVQRFGAAAEGSWTITLNGGAPLLGTVTIPTSENFLALQIGGNTYQLLLVGDAWIRLQDYPTGSFTDLFRVSGELEFRSLDETVLFEKN